MSKRDSHQNLDKLKHKSKIHFLLKIKMIIIGLHLLMLTMHTILSKMDPIVKIKTV